MDIPTLLKQHGPTLAIATFAVVAIKTGSHQTTQTLTMPTSDEVTAKKVATGNLPLPTTGIHAAPADYVATRVVSCGGRGAAVHGDDYKGIVTLGHESRSHCTVLFAFPGRRTCTTNGGDVVKTLESEFVVENIEGSAFAYRCE